MKSVDDIPPSIELPSSFDVLVEILDDYGTSALPVVYDRLIKCHHPRLKAGNKEKMAGLLVMAMRYFHYVASDDYAKSKGDGGRLRAESMVSVIYRLVRFNPASFIAICRRLLARHVTAWRQNKRSYPPYSCFAFLKLLTNLLSKSESPSPLAAAATLFITGTSIFIVGFGSHSS